MTENGSNQSTRYQVGDLIFDIGRREVTRADESLQLGSLTFQFLRVLVEFSPNVVTHDELAEHVWKGRAVSPDTIAQRALMLRQALGDEAEFPNYVEVIRGEGYRLIPDVTPVKATGDSARRKIPRTALAVIGAVAAIVAIALIGRSMVDLNPSENTTTPNPVRRFALTLGDFRALGPGAGAVRSEVALSPNGSHLAYIASIGDEPPRMFVRPLDQLEPQVISGSGSARRPFFSPNGEWIAFGSNVGTEIQIVSVRGGLPRLLTSGHNRMYGGTWSKDDLIVFSTSSDGNLSSGKLVSLHAEGGEPQDLLVPEQGTAYTWPHFLPDGKSLFFTIRETDGFSTDGSVAILSVETGQVQTLLSGAFNAKYSPTGHIIYARADTLWAAPFDVESLTITGPESPLFDGIQYNGRLGGVIYDFSDDGLLVYLLGDETYTNEQEDLVPVWVDRDGNETATAIPPKAYGQPRISPDGEQMSVSVFNGNDFDVWVVDLVSGKSSRLTFDASGEVDAVWTPDSERLIYASNAPDAGVMTRQANGVGTAQLISNNDIAVRVGAITPDGEQLLLLDRVGNESDMYLLSVNGEAYPQPFMQESFDEDHPAISPDGKYIAYESNESGREEVYVRSFPDLDLGKWLVSIDGGVEPRWSADGSELFFHDGVSPASTIFVADVTTNPDFSVSQPRVLVKLNSWLARSRYDVAQDGRRFLVLKDLNRNQADGSNEDNQVKLAVVENWFEELKRIKPSEP